MAITEEGNGMMTDQVLSAEAKDALESTIQSLSRRYTEVTLERMWLTDGTFRGRREWRATIILNDVSTRWRFSETRKRWRRSS